MLGRMVDRLTATHETAEKQLKAGARDVSATDVSRTLSYLRLAGTRRVQATQGVKRATAALREKSKRTRRAREKSTLPVMSNCTCVDMFQ